MKTLKLKAMKKLITLLTLVVCFTTTMFGTAYNSGISTTAPLQDSIILFPDTNFKSYLISNYSINTNHDNNITLREAWNYKGKIDISRTTVTNILGIEYFQNIRVLNCSNNPNIDSINFRLVNNIYLDSLILNGCNINKEVQQSYDLFLQNYRNLKYLDIRSNISQIKLTISRSLTLKVLVDSVVNGTNKLPGYVISTYPENYIAGSAGAWFEPYFKPIQSSSPFSCNNTIGLTSINLVYSKITWSTGDTTAMLFNKCSGVYTVTVTGVLVNDVNTYSSLITTFNVVDTVITTTDTTIYNYPNSNTNAKVSINSLKVIDSIGQLGNNILKITCPTIPPTLYGYHVRTDTNSTTGIVDTVVSFVYKYQNTYDTTKATFGISYGGLYSVTSTYYCFSFTRNTNAAAQYNQKNYVYIDLANLDQGLILVKATSSSATLVEDVTNSKIDITIAPNPFTTSTKVFVNPTHTNITVKLTNTIGIEVYNQITTNNVVEISREGLSSGMYFLQIISNDELIITEKVIIQ